MDKFSERSATRNYIQGRRPPLSSTQVGEAVLSSGQMRGPGPVVASGPEFFVGNSHTNDRVSFLALTRLVFAHHDSPGCRFRLTTEAAATQSTRQSTSTSSAVKLEAGDEVDVWRWSGLNEMFFRALKSQGMSGGAWLLIAVPCPGRAWTHCECHGQRLAG